MHAESSFSTRALGSGHSADEQEVLFRCRSLEQNPLLRIDQGEFSAEIRHVDGDPAHVNRIYLTNSVLTVELLPSKGLSVGEAFCDPVCFGDAPGDPRPIFWKPPLASLPDPDTFDPAESLLVGKNKKPFPGSGYIRTFYGGIELLGMYNWGMSFTNDKGELVPLHGDAAVRAVEAVRCTVSSAGCEVSGEYFSLDHLGKGRLCRITRTIVLAPGRPAIYVADRIENVTGSSMVPDWGYHITLRPQHGAEYLVPAKQIQMRGNGTNLDKHLVWRRAEQESEREEYGLIHKGIPVLDGALMGDPGVRTMVSYPDGTGVKIVMPPAPYHQSWYSAGGVNGTCFLLPGKETEEESIFLKNGWNGMGPEIGASALDHDGNIDPEVTVPELAPGESSELKILVEVLPRDSAVELAAEIRRFNERRQVVASAR